MSNSAAPVADGGALDAGGAGPELVNAVSGATAVNPGVPTASEALVVASRGRTKLDTPLQMVQPTAAGANVAEALAHSGALGEHKGAMAAVGSDASGVSSVAAASGDASTPAAALASRPESAAVTNARLVQTLSGSEMQVSLHAGELGRVTVHTALDRDTISAQITLESSHLGSTLSPHLSAIEQKLSIEHGLRASVTLDTQSQAGAGQGDRRSDQGADHRRSGTAAPGYTATSPGTEPLSSLPSGSSTTSSGPAGRRLLDIRI